MLGVRGRDSASACGGLGACAEAAVQPAPSFALHGGLRTRRARPCFGAASDGYLGRIIRKVMPFLKFGRLWEGIFRVRSFRK